MNLVSVHIHRIAAMSGGAGSFKVVIDGEKCYKLTSLAPDVDVLLEPGDHEIKFEIWPIGLSKPLVRTLEPGGEYGVLSWFTPDNGPHLLKPENRDQSILARWDEVNEVEEARRPSLGTLRGRLSSSLVVFIAFLILVGYWASSLWCDGHQITAVTLAVGGLWMTRVWTAAAWCRLRGPRRVPVIKMIQSANRGKTEPTVSIAPTGSSPLTRPVEPGSSAAEA